jgi:hypothetical protein
MNATPEGSLEASASLTNTPGKFLQRLDDPRVTQALEEYVALAESGAAPDRQAFLARHADIADVLAECLGGLEVLQPSVPPPEQPADDQSAEAHPEGPLGDFRIVREAGRGGMGIVYEAVQISLGRRVALKVLPFAAALDTRQLQRFKSEAQAAAHLHHQNIVPVYAVGCERGVHYYAMQFIEGLTIADVIRALRPEPRPSGSAPEPPTQPLPDGRGSDKHERGSATTVPVAKLSTQHSVLSTEHFRQVATWGVQAAEALEHAHDQGVIHRDIKPANLLIDGKNHLWITDFPGGLFLLKGRQPPRYDCNFW